MVGALQTIVRARPTIFSPISAKQDAYTVCFVVDGTIEIDSSGELGVESKGISLMPRSAIAKWWAQLVI